MTGFRSFVTLSQILHLPLLLQIIHNLLHILRAIFGADLLAEGRQLPGYEELTGLSGHKPWECVGELAESSLALLLLAGRPEWADHHVVKALAPRLRPKMPDMERVREEFLTPSDNHRLPVRFKDMMDAYIRGG